MRQFFCDACVEEENEDDIPIRATSTAAGKCFYARFVFPHTLHICFSTVHQPHNHETNQSAVETMRSRLRQRWISTRNDESLYRQCFIGTKITSTPCDKKGRPLLRSTPRSGHHPLETEARGEKRRRDPDDDSWSYGRSSSSVTDSESDESAGSAATASKRARIVVTSSGSDSSDLPATPPHRAAGRPRARRGIVSSSQSSSEAPTSTYIRHAAQRARHRPIVPDSSRPRSDTPASPLPGANSPSDARGILPSSSHANDEATLLTRTRHAVERPRARPVVLSSSSDVHRARKGRGKPFSSPPKSEGVPPIQSRPATKRRRGQPVIPSSNPPAASASATSSSPPLPKSTRRPTRSTATDTSHEFIELDDFIHRSRRLHRRRDTKTSPAAQVKEEKATPTTPPHSLLIGSQQSNEAKEISSVAKSEADYSPAREDSKKRKRDAYDSSDSDGAINVGYDADTAMGAGRRKRAKIAWERWINH